MDMGILLSQIYGYGNIIKLDISIWEYYKVRCMEHGNMIRLDTFQTWEYDWVRCTEHGSIIRLDTWNMVV